MSDIQRYAVIETALCIGGNVLDGEVEMVRASEHDAELAALREERATAVDMIKQSRERNAKLRQRRDAAEQLNEKHADHLRKVTGFVESLLSAASGQPSVATGYLRDILDSLNPTESGASE